MSITAARLQAEVSADTKQFDAGMAHADARVAAAPGKWSKAMKVGAGAGLAVGAAVVVRGVMGAITAGVASLRETGVVVAQTGAVIKSTGGAAGVTAAQIRDLATAVEDKTAIDDKSVQAGENMLLTFTNIRNEVGKGNDIFTQSVGVLADMSTAMGTDMKSGAIQLGKALNDPATGLTALTKAGVAFDAQQTARIKQFVKEGKVAEAQKVILAELNTEFHGSGAAFRASDTGQALAFQDAIEGIQQSVAKGLLPAITKAQVGLTHFLNDRATMGQAEALGNSIAAIFSDSNIATAAKVMTTAAGAISEAVRLFGSLPGEVQALAVGAVALNKFTGISPLDIAKTIGGAMFQRGATPMNPLFVKDIGGLKLPNPTDLAPAALLGVGWSAAGIATPLVLAAFSAVAAVGANDMRFGGKGLTESEIRAVKWSQFTQDERTQSTRHGFGEQKDQATLLASAMQKLNRTISNNPAWANVKTGAEVYGPLTTAVMANTAALGTNTAFLKPDAATAKSAQEADRKARGIKDTGPSKTLDPRLRFIAAGHSGAQDVAVSHALAVGFERGDTAAFQSDSNLAKAIRVLTADVKTVGKSAATAIGGDIERLKAEQARHTAAAAAKTVAAQAAAARAITERIKDQDLSAHVTVQITPAKIDFNLAGKAVGSALLPFIQTFHPRTS